MKVVRWTVAVCLLGASVAALLIDAPVWLVGALALGLTLRAWPRRSGRRPLRSTLPVVIFAGVIALMQWLSQGSVSTLPIKTVAVFLFITEAFRIPPWTDLLHVARPHSSISTLTLFALFVRHFTVIFRSESLRLLHARALCISRSYGPGSFRSLVGAVAALFGRAMARVERFYAAQLLRGLAE